MQIEPQTPLPLVYLITDHTDNNTYYVRAVIRDSLSGAILATVNLTDRGNRRFSSTINSPVDGTGLGRHIDITITPYTDSGYTTKADNYQERIDRWYVRAQRTGGGGGGGADIDYAYLIKKVREVVDKATSGIKFPATDLSKVLTAIEGVEKAVASITFPEIPEQKDVDLQPVLNAVRSAERALLGAVAAIDIPEPEKLDLQPAIQAVNTAERRVSNAIAKAAEKPSSEVARAASDAVREVLSEHGKKTEAVRKAMAQFAAGVDMSQPAPEPKKHKYFSK